MNAMSSKTWSYLKQTILAAVVFALIQEPVQAKISEIRKEILSGNDQGSESDTTVKTERSSYDAEDLEEDRP